MPPRTDPLSPGGRAAGGPARPRRSLEAVARWALVVGVLVALTEAALASARWGARHGLALWWLGAVAALAVAGAAGRLLWPHLAAWWQRWPLPRWSLPALVFVVAWGAALVPALTVDTAPFSDFADVYQGAQQVAAGNLDLEQLPYFSLWPYQSPFALYEGLVLWLSGGSKVPLLVIGATAMAGTNLLVFLLARRLAGSSAAGLACAFTFMAYPSQYLAASQLTNDHLATCLAYLGLYLALRLGWVAPGRRWRGLAWALLAGLVLALGNLMRPLGPVFLGAALVGLVYGGLRLAKVAGWRDARWRVLGLRAIAFTACYLAVGWAASGAIAAAGINYSHGTASTLPEWKFLIALTGNYTAGFELLQGPDGRWLPDANEKAARAIRHQVKTLLDNGTWPGHLAAQADRLWGRPDSAELTYPAEAAGQRALTAAETAAIERELHLERGLFPALVILAGAGVVVAARRSRAASRLEPGPAALTGAALAAFVCAYAAIHLVIEAQPRYRYAVMPAILALAAPAWRAILTHRRERRATVAAPTG